MTDKRDIHAEPAPPHVHNVPGQDAIEHTASPECVCSPVGHPQHDGTMRWQHHHVNDPNYGRDPFLADDMGAARWKPDPLMVDAVRSVPKASRRMQDLSDADRSWLVAGLYLAEVTATIIAERTGCSLRLVRSIRADPMTQMAWLWMRDVKAFERELYAERSAHSATKQQLACANRENARLRAQRDELLENLSQILGRLQAGNLKLFPRCGHPRVKFNIYRHDDRDHCRHCIRDRSAKYRNVKRSTSANTQKHDDRLHLVAVASGS